MTCITALPLIQVALQTNPMLPSLPLLQVSLQTNDMDLAGDVVQAVATFLNLEDLNTTIDFPEEMERLRAVLVKVWLTFCVLHRVP
ncbi:hypothetical protein DPMN_008096 [Dreissena polymorpha]|uniref:Uncharacterized protein n=1 Tax=Dreissena polymorpha TaxID=45954 RepID=A0A9D4MXQ8_DREPO|nr:hypothetical protein DPMN_008096 [Dreissena polymorpha]